MEVTKREVILSISIFSVLTIVGMLLYNLIDTKISDKQYIYDTALKIEDKDMFQWCLDTYDGNAFIYGDLKALQPVKCPLDESIDYYCIRRDYEEYTMHTRLVTYTDSKGHTHTRTETYWEWDIEDTDYYNTYTVEFCGIPFSAEKFRTPMLDYIGKEKISSDKRYVYHGCPSIRRGTIFTKLENNTIPDDCYLENRNIEELLEGLKSKFWLYFFLVCWIILEAALIFGFLYLDNNWLNRDNNK